MERQHFLDGIRGWGAIAVLLYHVFSDGFPLNSFSRQYLRLLPLFNGTGAVLVFFIISGFSLATPYFSRNDKSILTRIAVARYPRLVMPIFAICAVVHMAWSLGLIAPAESRFGSFGKVFSIEPTLWHLLQFSTFDVFFNYSQTISYAGPLWTMSIELLGSFIVIGVIAVTPMRFRFAGLGFIALALFCAGSVYCLFVFGALMAHCWQHRYDKEIANWALLSLFVVGILSPVFIEYRINNMMMLGMMCLTVFAVVYEPARIFFSSGLSRELGRISFPLYLVHGPVMMIAGAPLMLQYGRHYGFAVQILVVVLSITAAYLFVPVNEASLYFSRLMAKRMLNTP